MFLIRQARMSDLDGLLRLARSVYFINLPPDRDILEEKIRWSEESFRAVRHGESADVAKQRASLKHLGGAAGTSPQFMFVVEDPQTGNPLGTSAVIAQMGSPGAPNVSLRVRKKEFFSQDLQMGATHATVQLQLDESGPTEIGGLIVAPSYRGHASKLGKQLSLIRFHYIGLHPDRFQDRLLAEMMAPLTTDGRNTFWEYFGRRFINLRYDEADRFCQKSREFMTSLLPREEIYLTLLPAEARALVGQVHDDTVPARRMLEALGFAYRDKIDPFDAGPHLEAAAADVPLIRETGRATLGAACGENEATTDAFLSADAPGDDPEQFRAVLTKCLPERDGSVRATEAAMRALRVGPGGAVAITPLPAASAGAGAGVGTSTEAAP